MLQKPMCYSIIFKNVIFYLVSPPYILRVTHNLHSENKITIKLTIMC